MRTIECVFLVLICFIGIVGCFEFGYIVTNYPHGGQIFGVPFAIALVVYSLVIMLSKSPGKRRTFRIINYTYITSMSVYLLVISLIKQYKGEDSYRYLHHLNLSDLSLNERLFNGIAIGGVALCIVLLIADKVLIKRKITDHAS